MVQTVSIKTAIPLPILQDALLGFFLEGVRGMARLSTKQLEALKKCFVVDGLSPTQAAERTGITYGTAKRYYELWASDIKTGLEARLTPMMEESLRRMGKFPTQVQRGSAARRRTKP